MYWKNTKSWIEHIDFVLLDLASLQFAFVIAYMFRHGTGSPYETALYRGMAICLALLDLVVMIFFETMQGVLERGYYREFVATLQQAILVELLSIACLFAVRVGSEYSRLVLYGTGLGHLVISYVLRLIWKWHIRKKTGKGNRRALLIVTEEEIAEDVIRNLRENGRDGYIFAGLILTDCSRVGESIGGVRIVADVKTGAAYAIREWIDEVMIVPTDRRKVPAELAEQFMESGITTHISLAAPVYGYGKKMVERVAGYTVVTTSMKYVTTQEIFIKRTLDICGGLVGCFLTGVIFLFIAPAIKLQSPGPVFFTQIRIGKNGKRFKMYKFRSMYMDAEKRKKELLEKNLITDGMMFKMDFDPRVIGNRILPDGTKKTGLGQFIRSTSLDEFPQFFNVLKGDMSLVGTRPPTEDEWEKYHLRHRARLAVKPGITGLWQVSGRSRITDFEEVVKLDTEYIENWTIGQDIKILLKTVGVVLKRDGGK